MKKPLPIESPPLTPLNSLKSSIENRTVFNLNQCELNVFETYEHSKKVPLQFNDLVITSMLRGKKVMHLFNNDGFDYLPGETVIVPAKELMQIDFPEASFQNPTQCLALSVDYSTLSKTLDLLNERYPKVGKNNFWALNHSHFFFRNNLQMNQLIEKVISICRSSNIYKDALADIAIQELLITIMQHQSLGQIHEKGQYTNAHIESVMGEINKQITEKVTLKSLAKKAGMSISGLYRLFKSEMGISPMEYIMLRRIKNAKKLLIEPHIYVKNVAFEVGFEDANYFNRIFKKYEGLTPKEYQKVHSKEGN